MKRSFLILAALLVPALVAPLAQAAPDARADAEIHHLLSFVAASGCIFIRNGEPHDSKAASEHLAMKYGKAKAKLATPEQFIEYVATGSSFTGREYRVQCPGQPETASAVWLQRELLSTRRGSAHAAR